MTTLHGAEFTLNSRFDMGDGNPGDGVCETASGNGICTLRAAIQETNALSGQDTVYIPSGIYTLSIPGASEDAAAAGDLDIFDDLVIEGSGASTTIIDAAQLDRVMDLLLGTTLTINDVTLRNGAMTDLGGGLQNFGTLEMNRVIIRDNTANSGGGIFNYHDAIIRDSLISGNMADDLGYTNADGGGILNRGSLSIFNSTLSGNKAANMGAAIASTSADLTVLLNSTVSGNEGISAIIISNVDTIIRNSTIADNLGLGISYWNYNGIFSSAIGNTIISGNTTDCAPATFPLVSEGYNLVFDGTCGFSQSGDISGIDPMLEALADNGGITPTRALAADSPARDAGDPAGCKDETGALLSYDQRGELRPVDGNGDGSAICDIGAVEAVYTPNSAASGSGGGGACNPAFYLALLLPFWLVRIYRRYLG